jgi:hypothetical protein
MVTFLPNLVQAELNATIKNNVSRFFMINRFNHPRLRWGKVGILFLGEPPSLL